MPKPKTQIVTHDGEITLADGRMCVTVADLLSLPADAGPRGMIAISERAEFTVLTPEGTIVPVIASVYVQRGPLTPAEVTAVNDAATSRDTKQAQRKAQQAEELAKEKRAFASLAIDLLRDNRR